MLLNSIFDPDQIAILELLVEPVAYDAEAGSISISNISTGNIRVEDIEELTEMVVAIIERARAKGREEGIAARRETAIKAIEGAFPEGGGFGGNGVRLL